MVMLILLKFEKNELLGTQLGGSLNSLHDPNLPFSALSLSAIDPLDSCF